MIDQISVQFQEKKSTEVTFVFFEEQIWPIINQWLHMGSFTYQVANLKFSVLISFAFVGGHLANLVRRS